MVVDNIIAEKSNKDHQQANSELKLLKKGGFDQFMIGGQEEQKKAPVVTKTVAQPTNKTTQAKVTVAQTKAAPASNTTAEAKK